MSAHDPRLTPARADIAAAALKGEVEAATYVDGTALRCVVGKTWLRRRARDDAPVETEILLGEEFSAYDVKDGFAWGQAGLDGYVGYVDETTLATPGPKPTHRVTALSTFLYAAADLKSPVLSVAPMNARLAATGEDDFLDTGAGFVFTKHVAPLEARVDDWVSVAERFVGVPYLWGGRTPLGCDCSGLVQAAMQMAGLPCPRDTDMQEGALGRPVTTGDGLQGLQRGDLVFWKGHVGVMQDAVRLLHANAHHMAVMSEPLGKAVQRIAAKGAPVTSVRRL